MTTTITQNLDSTTLYARQLIAASLSMALADPYRLRSVSVGPWLDSEMLSEAWSILADQVGGVTPSQLGLGEIVPDTIQADCLTHFLRLPYDRREPTYRAVFGMLVSNQCPPAETEYAHWKDPTYRAQQLADIAGFQNAFGLEPSANEGAERPDHISLEIEFIAFLIQRLQVSQQNPDAPREIEATEVTSEALTNFISDHIAWWVPTFGKRVEQQIDALLENQIDGPQLTSDLRIFRAVASVLRAWVACERIFNNVEPCRRIIAPEVDLPPVCEGDDSCGECGVAD